MARPTPREAEEMKIRRLVKDIWGYHYRRKRNELTRIAFKDNSNFIEISVGKKSIEIHKSSFENYFNSKDKEQRRYSINHIKKILDQLI